MALYQTGKFCIATNITGNFKCGPTSDLHSHSLLSLSQPCIVPMYCTHHTFELAFFNASPRLQFATGQYCILVSAVYCLHHFSLESLMLFCILLPSPIFPTRFHYLYHY